MNEQEKALENWTNQCDHALEQGLAPPAPGCEVSKEAASEVVLGLSTLQSVWPGQSRHGNSSVDSSATSTSNQQGELQDFSSQPQSPADGFYQLGKFKLLEKLGEGGFGMVFRALDTSLGREVALKLPRNRFEPDEKRALRFRRETESLARCDHICIVPILEAGEIEGDLYMASHLCQGPSLAAWLGARETPVPPKQSAAIAMQLAHGLAHAHSAGIIHRELKPSNVLVDGETDAASGVPPVRITDFGLASWTEEVERNTATGELFGTVNYMSPEQVAGNESVDHRSDIFSLGSILYEMLIGKPPHASESLIDSLRSTREDAPVPPRQLQPNVSRDL
ncbi:MAG: serine/threonine-protein kinase, partial [Planctomycetota bacterium]